MNKNKALSLRILDFAQIKEASLDFGDLTVLVGPQGSGKSLAIQWLKVAIDGKEVIQALRQAGQEAEKDRDIVNLIFGVGMGDAWRDGSKVIFAGRGISPRQIYRRGKDTGSAFFIPAHRSMLISDGWPAPFQKLSADTPVVARLFSQNLFDLFSGKEADRLFPVAKRLKQEYRDLIDRSIFHGGTVELERDPRQLTKRLRLSYGGSRLPFMTWTAGQREFTPLLLGLYHLLPGAKMRKRKEIDWVIIEEPEMGLHPQAVTVFLILVLDLLWRGYRVVLTTHSPHLLTGVWMLQRLKQHKARKEILCHALDLPPGSPQVQKVVQTALTKHYKVFFFRFGDDGKVTTFDISDLDPDSENVGEAEWGGLTGFSSRFGEAVRIAVNEGG